MNIIVETFLSRTGSGIEKFISG